MKQQHVTGPLPYTDEIAEQPHANPRKCCPVCGVMVTFRIAYGAVMLDYHRNPRNNYATCNGSDFNMSEAAE